MLVLLFALCWHMPADALKKDYFTAAVFEHKPEYFTLVKEPNPNQHKIQSLDIYAKAVHLAAQKGTDIIVFNEYGTLNYPALERGKFLQFAEHVPDPKINFNPCEEHASERLVLYKTSCLARKYHMYIQVNVMDVQPCEKHDKKCPSDGKYFYNTNVVFDRRGNIIARYHKMHPFVEATNIPNKPEYVTFDTDFGKFGTVICFDLAYNDSVKLVKDYNIDTLLYSTYWYDEIYPLDAVELQQAFAIGQGVNLLAANAHASFKGSLGSGIYTKDDGALVYTYEPNGLSKLLIANVRIRGNSKIPTINSITAITKDKIFPIKETGESFPENSYAPLLGPPENMYTDYRTYKLQTENHTVVKLEKASDKLQVCSNGLCCSLSYSTHGMKDDFFLGVFNGLNNVRGIYKRWDEICVLTRCDPYHGKPCLLQPSRSKTAFKSFELKAKFDSEDVFPAVTKTNLRLAPKGEWDFEKKGNEAKIVYKSQSKTPFLRAILYGADFKRDPPFVSYVRKT